MVEDEIGGVSRAAHVLDVAAVDTVRTVLYVVRKS